MRRLLPLTGIFLILALLGVGAFLLTRPYTFHGSLIQEPYAAPDFSLPDGKGGEFHLASQRGRVVLLFFGFTNCPDVCPTTLADLKQVRKMLGADADKLQVVFITVDPERDTTARSSAYAAGFDPTFAGLSGSEQQLSPVWQSYGVYRKLNKTSPSDTTYEVEHSSQVYLVDESGNLRLTFSYGTPIDDIYQDVRQILKDRS